MMRALPTVFLLMALLWASQGATHEAHDHAKAPATAPAPAAVRGGGALPFDVGGAFSLIDHRGREVTEQDFLGRPFLVFFGYSKCRDFCPVGLRVILDALDLLGEKGAAVQPLMITVDAENDTPEALAEFVGSLHPRLTGLTGSPEALAAVRKSYNVRARKISQSLLTGEPIFGHGAYVYLMGPEGNFLTILPPVLSPEQMAGIIASYLEPGEG